MKYIGCALLTWSVSLTSSSIYLFYFFVWVVYQNILVYLFSHFCFFTSGMEATTTTTLAAAHTTTTAREVPHILLPRVENKVALEGMYKTPIHRLRHK